MKDKLQEIKNRVLKEIKEINLPEELEKLEKNYLGRKGEFTKLIKDIKDLAVEQRPVMGKLANEIKNDLTDAFLPVTFPLKIKITECAALSPPSFFC